MACGSGCCGEPASVSHKQPSSDPASGAVVQNDRDSCCDDADLAIDDENPDQLGIVGATRDELTENENCCAPRTTARPTPDSDCKKGCRSAPEPPRSDDTPVPGCCEGKTAPCCDQSCLDRLALRECENSGSRLTPRSMSLSMVHTRSAAHIAKLAISQAQLPLLAGEARTASHARIMRTRPA